MGVSTELATSRRGAALPTALFGLVTVSVLATAIFASSRTQSQATRNRESSTRAIQLADNAMTHALLLVGDSLKGYPFDWLLKGSDNNATTAADNGRLTGYILSAAADIPAAGRAGTGGTYTAQVIDDADNGNTNLTHDVNLKVIVRCTATTDDGGSATIDAMITQVVLPAFAAEGNVTIGGNNSIVGKCGALHANGNVVLPVGGNKPVISGTITASGTATGGAVDTLSVAKAPVAGATQVTIPDLNPGDYCPAGARWILRADGKIVDGNTGTVHNSPWKGWAWSAGTKLWDFTNSGGPEEGKVCADGNVKLTSNFGTTTDPFNISIIATGSVWIAGNPFIAPASVDSILIVSGGDVQLTGNVSGTANNYEGLIYAENQCVMSGTPRIAAQVLCKNKSPTFVSAPMTAVAGFTFVPFTVTEYAATNTMSGSAQIVYQCGGVLAKRRVASWVQRVN